MEVCGDCCAFAAVEAVGEVQFLTLSVVMIFTENF